MTLKSKNRYTMIFSMFYLGLSAFFLIYFLLRLPIILKGNSSSIYSFFFEDFSQNFMVVLISEFFLLAYVPITAFYIYSHFLKTPAIEVIYFMLFLFGCTSEFLRLFIITEAITNTLTEFYVFLGRALFWGRILCFTSLFLGAVIGTPDQRINTEQNIFIAVIFSLILAYFVPIDTASITKHFSIKIGMSAFVSIFCSVAAALTFATYSIKAWQNEDKKYLTLGFDIILVQAGIAILTNSGILVLAIFGMLLLAIGTFHYLKSLHKTYV